MSLILHINGWPGTGKLTIARLLAGRLDACLIDNHVLLGPAQTLYSHGSADFYRLFRAVRDLVFAEIATLPADRRFIFTDALGEQPDDVARFERVRALAAERGARFVAVRLDISPEENTRRIVSPDRALKGKLSDPQVLRGLRSRHQLLLPRGDFLDLEVSDLSPEAAADTLLARLGRDTDKGE